MDNRTAPAFVVIAVFSLSANLFAQSRPVTLPRNDVSAAIGWIGTEYSSLPRYHRWHDSVYLAGSGGRYWTDHLKTEIEAGWIARMEDTVYAPVVVEGIHAAAESAVRIEHRRVSIGQSYQFGRNAWVHPFVGAGIDVDWVRQIEERRGQSVYLSGRPGGTALLPALHTSQTDVRVRPFVKGGWKFYVSDRAFVSTDFKFGIHSGVNHVLWRNAVGLDF